jgi:hypothetical protein
MVILCGIPFEEAIARLNRQWSAPDSNGRTLRVWIVGLGIIYHETPEYWAHDSRRGRSG